MNNSAVFLDRDGTLIEDPGYISDPEKVILLPGVAEAIRCWNEAGYRVVVVSNQSGVARGIITEDQLEEVNAQVELLLEEQNAELDAIYCCPYLDGPEAVVPEYRRDSDLRKPRPGMLLQAAEELDLDLANSWVVGDSPRDIQAGLAAGCRTVLVSPTEDPSDEVDADYIVSDLNQAAEIVLKEDLAAADRRPASIDNTLSNAAEASGPLKEDNVLEVLRDIRSLLHQQRRESTQSDFSLARLGATLFQMMAVAILLWGIAALVSHGDGAGVQALIRFTLAGVVQLLALTLFLTDRSK